MLHCLGHSHYNITCYVATSCGQALMASRERMSQTRRLAGHNLLAGNPSVALDRSNATARRQLSHQVFSKLAPVDAKAVLRRAELPCTSARRPADRWPDARAGDTRARPDRSRRSPRGRRDPPARGPRNDQLRARAADADDRHPVERRTGARHGSMRSNHVGIHTQASSLATRWTTSWVPRESACSSACS